MKTKKLTPRSAAPVQREINTTSSQDGTGMTPHAKYVDGDCDDLNCSPFAGDDAE